MKKKKESEKGKENTEEAKIGKTRSQTETSSDACEHAGYVFVPGVFSNVSEDDPEPSKGSNWKSSNCTVPTHFNQSNTHIQKDTLPSPCEVDLRKINNTPHLLIAKST